jgi:hypothetical protein
VLENIRQVLGRDAQTRVADRHLEGRRLLARPDTQLDPPARRRVAQRVLQQVPEDLGDPVGVDVSPGQVVCRRDLQPDAPPLGARDPRTLDGRRSVEPRSYVPGVPQTSSALMGIIGKEQGSRVGCLWTLDRGYADVDFREGR